MTYVSHADLGGRDRPGAVVPEPEGDTFHAPWEARALALTLAMGGTGAWNIDTSRVARETLPRLRPAELLPDLARGARGDADRAPATAAR